MGNETSQYIQVLPQLLQQIQQIQTLLAQMYTQLNNANKNGGKDSNNSGGNNSNKVSFWRKFYFWNHGEFNHQGSLFRMKAEGCKDIVTFNKQLNRSNEITTIMIKQKCLMVCDRN